eukprot:TRINITY_DN91944_c0_g1_i1.p1 TRINITY_DN91944_c0_g1~~TRINITY_DN91944_c0_g1_i1.p1  ORF type:complete len:874 (-),score=177.57 TRINITY_DN91944_c0_g1_i1:99-2720(-)
MSRANAMRSLATVKVVLLLAALCPCRLVPNFPGSVLVSADVAPQSLSEEPAQDRDVAETQKQGDCPVNLLDVVEGDQSLEGLALSEDGLAYLERQRSPIYLVPAVGVYRGGKSLLLNRLMRLQAPYQDGFGVGHGQQTYTRGLSLCAEELPNGAGTVVWMDTEGLFSSEDARSSYGPKIFSLALLFSSVVLLNNVKVMNEQFFGFFEEQQQVARVLRQGLISEGLPSTVLLPGNLSIVWVLQQPISYDATAESSKRQLSAFLSLKEEARERVKRDFNHLTHEVPAASHDVRLWSRLDELSDKELLPEYIEAAAQLRVKLLALLPKARPLQAASVASQLRMYTELVQNSRFSGELAKEAFEEAEIGRLCGSFATMAREVAGSLPTDSLADAFASALESVESEKVRVAEEFHFNGAWVVRLQACFQRSRQELLSRNSELVLSRWKDEAQAVASAGGCFFLGELASLLQEYRINYGQAFDSNAQALAVEFGNALQRTRLVECVRLRDFLVPMLPWIAWPVLHFYLRNGITGLVTMALHGIMVAGIYAMLQFFKQLPPYLDVDYQVLRHHPGLVPIAMRIPPQLPWEKIGWFFGCAGLLRTARMLHRSLRMAGHAQAPGLTNLELKLNMSLRRSEALVKQQLVSAAFEASMHADCGDARAAACALVRGLALVAQIESDDLVLSHLFEEHHCKKAKKALKHFRTPGDGPLGKKCCASNAQSAAELPCLAADSNWDALLPAMAELLGQLGQSDAQPAEHRFQPIEASPVSTVQQSSSASPEQASTSLVTDQSPELENSKKRLFDDGLDTSMATEESEADAEDAEDHDDEEDEEECSETGSWFRTAAMALATFAGVAVSAALMQASGAAGLLPPPRDGST